MAIIYDFATRGGIEMEVNVFHIAKFFLSKNSMTHKKLQKLCYYAQAWHLALNYDPLFEGEFEAWVHGPVCPELYSEYKKHGYDRIPKEDKIPEELDRDAIDFLESVYDTYGSFTGDQLESLTHMEAPWKEARAGLEEWMPSHNVISRKTMEVFYREVYENEPEA